jgi:hypothetical protein
LLALVVDAEGGAPDVDLHKRLILAGAAVKNDLSIASAQGFGSALNSGKALKSAGLQRFLALDTSEHAVCVICGGSAAPRCPAPTRPTLADCLSVVGERPQFLPTGTPWKSPALKTCWPPHALRSGHSACC